MISEKREIEFIESVKRLKFSLIKLDDTKELIKEKINSRLLRINAILSEIIFNNTDNQLTCFFQTKELVLNRIWINQSSFKHYLELSSNINHLTLNELISLEKNFDYNLYQLIESIDKKFSEITQYYENRK